MKNLLPSLLLAFLLLACEKYDTIASCTDVSGVQITFDNAPCQVPCRKTFNLSEFNLVQGAELTWTLSGPNGPITLDDPKAATIDVDLLEGGVYTITVQVDFPFDGCDFSRDNTFAVGVDPPQPVIKASATSCTVGMCDLKFWQENADTASLSWSFPDGNKRANQDTVLYNFNDAPGTYEICLEACNIGGCTSACVTISVLPKTFILDNDNNLNLEKIICIKENADGSFSAIGSNKNQTFTIDISRDGVLDSMSLVKLPGLEAVYDEFEALACRPLDGNYLAYGTARRGQNIDMYMASFNPNMVPNDEETLFQDSTGNEIVNGITSGINGGLVACGTASGGLKTGMVFFEADPSLELQSGKVHFPGSSINQALDILNRGDHYLVVGRARRPVTNDIQAVHFTLDSKLERIADPTYFGSEYTPTHLVPTIAGVLLVAQKGTATSVIRLLNESSPERPFPNTDFQQTIVTSDNRLATVGYHGDTDKKPLLQILSLPDLIVLNTINEPYPLNNGKFFCISETADGGFIMGGTINTGGRDQILVIRTDIDGKIL